MLSCSSESKLKIFMAAKFAPEIFVSFHKNVLAWQGYSDKTAIVIEVVVAIKVVVVVVADEQQAPAK